MDTNEIADQWYPGHPAEKELFNDDTMGTPNNKAMEVYAILLSTNTVKAEKFYDKILKPFD
jgi:hypothetical protein